VRIARTRSRDPRQVHPARMMGPTVKPTLDYLTALKNTEVDA
jgi:hypothetical protein